jgi:hypothetical protein
MAARFVCFQLGRSSLHTISGGGHHGSDMAYPGGVPKVLALVLEGPFSQSVTSVGIITFQNKAGGLFNPPASIVLKNGCI